MKTYRAAVIGCSWMGAFIGNEVTDYQAIGYRIHMRPGAALMAE